jgi:hypothetical protein
MADIEASFDAVTPLVSAVGSGSGIGSNGNKMFDQAAYLISCLSADRMSQLANGNVDTIHFRSNHIDMNEIKLWCLLLWRFLAQACP